MIKKMLNILAVFVFLLLIPINLFSFDKDFYFSEFNKYRIYNEFNRDVNLEFEKVLSYIENGEKIEGEFFNNKEKEHLIDVRRLFIVKDTIIIGSLITLFILSFNLKKKEFLDNLKIGGIATLIFVIILGIISLIDFNSFFIKFHEIFFTNNLWMLNPDTDNLIKLLPKEIFFDILKRSLFLSFILGLIVINLRRII